MRDDLRHLVAVTKALADESRIRILAACARGELCVCQIIELLGLAPSTVSKHLWILRAAGLLDSRKEGRWMYYRLPDAAGSAVVGQAIAFVRRSLHADPSARDDAKRLKAIVATDPVALCCRQRESACCAAPTRVSVSAARAPRSRSRADAASVRPRAGSSRSVNPLSRR